MRKNISSLMTSKNILIALTVLCCFFIGTSFFTDTLTKPLKKCVSMVVVPVQKGMNNIGFWVYDKYQTLQEISVVLDENKNLQSQIDELTEENEDYQTFLDALLYVNTCLAKKIAGDGEGATALFEVKVVGAESKEQAVTLSKSIITSNLTKAAIFGHDANWGRILCAMGYSGAQFDPEKVDLYFESKAGKLQIIKDGVATDYSEEEATKILSEKEVTAIADVKMGEATATAWGCDLTYDYVKINADYRS